jgi:hypothetical protein
LGAGGSFRTRARIGAICVTIVLGGAAAALIATSHHPDKTATILGGVAGAFALLFAVGYAIATWPTGQGAQALDDELRRAADDLARSVDARWRQEAGRRKIGRPATIYIRWRRAPRRQTTLRAIPTFLRPRAIPTRAGERRLDDALLQELDGLYRAAVSGKVVVIGMPGAGKTGVLIQMLIHALSYRAQPQFTRDQRYDIPVPVLLTLGDWVPPSGPTPLRGEEDLLDWAARALRDDFSPAFTSSGASIYRALLDDGRISLFLDGLEEMPDSLWDRAVSAIDRVSNVRVVLTARPRAALLTRRLSPDRIRLDAVDVKEAAHYLTAACDPDLHTGAWGHVAKYMRANPDSGVARALTTPLTLSLALNSFDRGARNPEQLCSLGDELGAPELERYLLRQIIDVAYDLASTRPHDLGVEEARAYLTELAQRMGAARDLHWWRMRRWSPSVSPALLCTASFLAVAGVATVLGGIALGAAVGLPAACVGSVVAGLIASHAVRRGADQQKGLRPRLIAASALGILFGLLFGRNPFN